MILKMTEAYSIATPIAIYILTPPIGLLYYLSIRKKMIKADVAEFGLFEMFILFATYGGLLTLVLTTFFWEWSGMASLGCFYLILIAPILMLIIAVRNYKKRKTSIYSEWIFYLAISYYIITPLTLIILFHFSKN